MSPPRGNHLKLMVDYNLKDPDILQKLNSLGALDVKTTIELGYAQNAKDRDLILSATLKEDRILLTRDYNTINEHRFTPCMHGGVVILHHRRPSADVVKKMVNALLKCGERRHAKGHVTHIRRDGIKIVTHDAEPVIVSFDEKPNLRKIVAGI